MENPTMEQQKFDIEIEQVRAATAKLQAETMKLNKESRYYVLSLILGSTVLGAVIALVSAFATALFLK